VGGFVIAHYFDSYVKICLKFRKCYFWKDLLFNFWNQCWISYSCNIFHYDLGSFCLSSSTLTFKNRL